MKPTYRLPEGQIVKVIGYYKVGGEPYAWVRWVSPPMGVCGLSRAYLERVDAPACRIADPVTAGGGSQPCEIVRSGSLWLPVNPTYVPEKVRRGNPHSVGKMFVP